MCLGGGRGTYKSNHTTLAAAEQPRLACEGAHNGCCCHQVHGGAALEGNRMYRSGLAASGGAMQQQALGPPDSQLHGCCRILHGPAERLQHESGGQRACNAWRSGSGWAAAGAWGQGPTSRRASRVSSIPASPAAIASSTRAL